jgi:hypothetical protein
MNQKYLCVEYGSKNSAFRLHQKSENSRWEHIDMNLNQSQQLLLSDIPFKVLDKDVQINSVLSVIGVALGKSASEKIQMYYLILLPAENKDDLNIYWLALGFKNTKRINNKVQHTILQKMWSNGMDLLNTDNLAEIQLKLKLSTKIDRELIPLEHMGMVCLGPTETLCQFYIVARKLCMVGLESLKTLGSICMAFNSQSFGIECKEVVLSLNQAKNKERISLKRKQIDDDSLNPVQIISQSTATHGLYVLPPHVTEAAILSKNRFDELIPINDKRFNRFGIRSILGKNKLPVIPTVGSIHEELPQTKYLSEKHVVQSVENVFQTVYSASEIVKAIDLLIIQCMNEHFMDSESIDEVVGAVMSTLFEDLSWRLRAETPLPFNFKSVNVDIDQVRSILFELLYSFTVYSFNRPH